MRRQSFSGRRSLCFWLVFLSLPLLLPAVGCSPMTRVTVVSYLPYSIEVYEQSPTLDHQKTVVPPLGRGKTFIAPRGEPFRLRFQRDDGRLVQVFYHAPASDIARSSHLVLAISESGVSYLPDVPPDFPAAPEVEAGESWPAPILAVIAGGGWGLVLSQWFFRWIIRRRQRAGVHNA